MDNWELTLDPVLVKRYRNVFSGREGSIVLAHMLYELKVFAVIGNMGAEDAAHKNYGCRLMTILGAGEISMNTLTDFATRLMSQPLKEEKES